MFMWLDEDWVCPHANPTYSLKLTPKEDDAVGKRVRFYDLSCKDLVLTGLVDLILIKR